MDNPALKTPLRDGGRGESPEKPPELRYVFLNALPLNALRIEGIARLVVTRVDPKVLKQLVPLMKRTVSFIRHASTVRLLNRVFGLELQPSNGFYEYEDGDVLMVVTLRRPRRGIDVFDLSIDDIEIYMVEVEMGG